MKKLLLGSLLAIVFALIATPAAAQTLVVDDDGQGTAADCDAADTAHSTIQAGVDAAADGDTVFVCPGTYDEQVVINTKSITLQGSGDDTLIQPSSPTTLDQFYTYPGCVLPGWAGLKLAPEVLVEDSPNTVVEDLAIDGSNVTSLPSGSNRLSGVTYGESGGRIENLTISNIKTTGYVDRSYVIDVSACEDTARAVDVIGNTIDDYSRAAIQVQGNDLTATIDNNTVIGPGTIGPQQVPNGIVFIEDAIGSADGNTLSAMHHTGSNSRSAAFLVFGANLGAVTFSNNEVFDVDDAVILASQSSAVTVGPDNDFHDNLKGVQIENGAHDNLIVDNSITSNSTAGIQLEGSENPVNSGTDAGLNNEAHGNIISGNGAGVLNYISSDPVFNAEENWWGDSSGPSGAGPGSGDSVSADVDFDPWCYVPDCSQTTTAGGAIEGSPGDDVIEGTGGDDTINGGGGDDTITGGGGNDAITGGGGDDTINGGGGDDTISAGAGDDTISGGSGNDILSGRSGSDSLNGGSGDDILSGGKGADSLFGGSGNDTLSGGPGPDSLFGQDGSDDLTGNRGRDLMNGGAGNDSCSGNKRDDFESC